MQFTNPISLPIDSLQPAIFTPLLYVGKKSRGNGCFIQEKVMWSHLFLHNQSVVCRVKHQNPALLKGFMLRISPELEHWKKGPYICEGKRSPRQSEHSAFRRRKTYPQREVYFGRSGWLLRPLTKIEQSKRKNNQILLSCGGLGFRGL